MKDEQYRKQLDGAAAYAAATGAKQIGEGQWVWDDGLPVGTGNYRLLTLDFYPNGHIRSTHTKNGMRTDLLHVDFGGHGANGCLEDSIICGYDLYIVRLFPPGGGESGCVSVTQDWAESPPEYGFVWDKKGRLIPQDKFAPNAVREAAKGALANFSELLSSVSSDSFPYSAFPNLAGAVDAAKEWMDASRRKVPDGETVMQPTSKKSRLSQTPRTKVA